MIITYFFLGSALTFAAGAALAFFSIQGGTLMSPIPLYVTSSDSGVAFHLLGHTPASLPFCHCVAMPVAYPEPRSCHAVNGLRHSSCFRMALRIYPPLHFQTKGRVCIMTIYYFFLGSALGAAFLTALGAAFLTALGAASGATALGSSAGAFE